MSLEVFITLVPDSDKSELTKQQKQFEKAYTKSSKKLGKTFSKDTSKGIAEGLKKGARTAGRIGKGVAKGGGIALGAIAGLLLLSSAESDKAIGTQEETQRRAEVRTVLASTGDADIGEISTRIGALQRQGFTFDEAAQSIANIIDQRTQAQLGQDSTLLNFAKGGTVEAIDAIIQSLQNETNKNKAFIQATKIFGPKTAKIILGGGDFGEDVEATRDISSKLGEESKNVQELTQQQDQQRGINKIQTELERSQAVTIKNLQKTLEFEKTKDDIATQRLSNLDKTIDAAILEQKVLQETLKALGAVVETLIPALSGFVGGMNTLVEVVKKIADKLGLTSSSTAKGENSVIPTNTVTIGGVNFVKGANK